MPSNNFIKNITSKDTILSKNTILNMIKASSTNDFEELCQKSDFIFSFLKERIIKDFVNLIKKENLKTVFEFSKIYCSDFEDLIINSWLKFADEDLTDEILELFENGSQEQKTYCAKYFQYIQDPLALEYLYKYSYSDFEPLKINCALTLRAFKDIKIIKDMKNIILNSDDEFEKNSAYSFICAYQSLDNINFIADNYYKSPFRVQIISKFLDFYSFEDIKKLQENKIIQIFSTILEGYPEDIALDTIGYYRIIDFIKLINTFNNQYAKNVLILAREKFKEFFENDIYSYDLDKNLKHELKEIYNYLKNLDLDTANLNKELEQYNLNRYEIALNVIQELKLIEFANGIIQSLDSLNETFIAKAVLVLKELDAVNLIPSSITDKIQNENIKALVKSCIQ